MSSNAFILKVCVDPTSHSYTGHVRAFGTNTRRIFETLLAQDPPQAALLSFLRVWVWEVQVSHARGC